MALSGKELLYVEPVDGVGASGPGKYLTTTQEIANLSGGGGLTPIPALNLLANATGGSAIPGAVAVDTTLLFSGSTLKVNPGTQAFNGGSADNMVIGGVIPAPGTFSALNTLLTVDPAGTGALVPNAIQTTLNPSTSSNDIFINFLSILTLNGPGVFNKEINLINPHFIVSAGASSNQSEDIETRMDNSGIIGSHTGLLDTQFNTATGTVTGVLSGASYILSNLNTTAGAITAYVAIAIGPMSGGGSIPTTYLAFQNTDPLKGMVQAGNMIIGKNANISSSIMCEIFSSINAGFNTNNTIPFVVFSAAGVILFEILDNNTATFGATLSLGKSSSVTGLLRLFNASTGLIQLVPQAGATTTTTLTLPNTGVNDVFALLGVSQTFSGAVINFSGAVTANGTLKAAGHLLGGGTIPTINSGGTLDAGATDLAGTVTTTTASTGFVVTWSTAYGFAPHVNVSSPSGNAFTSYTATANTLTVVCAALTGATFTYQVMQ